MKKGNANLLWVIVGVLVLIVAARYLGGSAPPPPGNNGTCTMSVTGLNCTAPPPPPPPVGLPPPPPPIVTPPPPVTQYPGSFASYGASQLTSSGLTITGPFSVKYNAGTATLTQVDWYVNTVKYRSEYVAPYYIFGDTLATGFVNVSTFSSYPTQVCAKAILNTAVVDSRCITVVK